MGKIGDVLVCGVVLLCFPHGRLECASLSNIASQAIRNHHFQGAVCVMLIVILTSVAGDGIH